MPNPVEEFLRKAPISTTLLAHVIQSVPIDFRSGILIIHLVFLYDGAKKKGEYFYPPHSISMKRI